MAVIQSNAVNILVQELTKKNPNTDLIKNKTEVLGIRYNPDLIVLMTEVLVFLSQKENKKSFMKDKPA
jgi:hypothetical protein